MKLEIQKDKQNQFTEMVLGALELCEQDAVMIFEEGKLKLNHFSASSIYGLQLELNNSMFEHLPQGVIWITPVKDIKRAIKAFKNGYTIEEVNAKLVITKGNKKYTLDMIDPSATIIKRKDLRHFKPDTKITLTQEIMDDIKIACEEKDSLKYILQDRCLTIQTNKYSSIHNTDTDGQARTIFSDDICSSIFKAYPKQFTTLFLGTDKPAVLQSVTEDWDLIVAIAPRVEN